MIEDKEYEINVNVSSEHLGDCLELMKYIPNASIDMILCDLPYKVTGLKWDSFIDLNKIWKEYERIITNKGAIVLTSMQPFTTELIMSNKNPHRLY